MRSAMAILDLATILTGCVTTEKSYSDLTGRGRELNGLKMDGATCEMALAQSPAVQPVAAGSTVGLTVSNIGVRMMQQNDFFDSCMLSRGWERKRSEEHT